MNFFNLGKKDTYGKQRRIELYITQHRQSACRATKLGWQLTATV